MDGGEGGRMSYNQQRAEGRKKIRRGSRKKEKGRKEEE